MNAHVFNVLATPRFFDPGTRAFLEANNCRVIEPELDAGTGDANFSAEHLISLACEADGWLLGQARVTADVIAALPRLKIIARRGVGYERVDIEAARSSGIAVTIGTGGNDASTADHALALMLAAGRRLHESQQRMRDGNWSILVGGELYAKTVGIIGFGRVARGVIQRLKGFSCEVIVATPRPDVGLGEQLGIRFVPLPELLAQSDYVSLHLPLMPQTRNMIDAEALALMKSSAILVNTARGGLVDEVALLDALRNGRIGGAGLDVFLSETDPAARPVADALLALPNVVGTPHAAGSTREGLVRTNMIAAGTILDVLAGRAPPAGTVVVAGR
jgi:D-3-phosphoglycerate dehydrogenase / 2-oxoglutarate reductase